MLSIESRIRFLFDEKIVGVIRTRTASDALNVVKALVAGGFKAVEVPMTVPDAVNVLKELVQTVGDGVMVGAGTVMTAADARACIEAGCQFIVAPSAEFEIIRPCREAGVVAIPGAATPTEIAACWRAGAHVVKVFPAATLGGPDYIRAVRGPFPHIPLWVSGMVTSAQSLNYLKAGAQLVGLTNELMPQNLMDANDWEGIRDHARACLAAAKGAKA